MDVTSTRYGEPNGRHGPQMTDTQSADVIHEALALIDRGLGQMLHRELVSTDEVSDLLLYVRMLLTAAEMAAASGVPVEPVGA